MPFIIGTCILIIALIILVNCIKIVPQANAYVVERLGAYLSTWSVGVHFKTPFIDRVAKRVLLKEPDKCFLYLALSMLYNELGDKKLSAIHLKSFINRYKGKKEHYLTKTIKKLQNDKCLTCVNEYCENCEKIAS